MRGLLSGRLSFLIGSRNRVLPLIDITAMAHTHDGDQDVYKRQVLNNRRLREREADLLRYKRELEIGREIQLSFLPSRLPHPPGWELVSHFQPALEVAGDFYDAFTLPHGHVALVIADVVGKGVTAALFMAIIRSLFRALFQQNYYHTEPAVAGMGVGAMTPFSFVDRGALLNACLLYTSRCV